MMNEDEVYEKWKSDRIWGLLAANWNNGFRREGKPGKYIIYSDGRRVVSTDSIFWRDFFKVVDE